MNEARYHPLALVAFLSAVFFLVLPVQADIVYGAFKQHMIKTAALVVVATIAVVVFPQIVAQQKTSRYPDKWKPRFLSKLTWAIVVLNVVFNAIIFINYGIKKSEAEHIVIRPSHNNPSNSLSHAP